MSNDAFLPTQKIFSDLQIWQNQSQNRQAKIKKPPNLMVKTMLLNILSALLKIELPLQSLSCS